MRQKRFVSAMLSFALCSAILMSQSPVLAAEGEDVVVFYTNDMHCGIDGELNFSSLSALEQRELDKNNTVILADAGDAIQGGAIGTLSSGEYMTNIMNFVGYDIAVPGNHEFDYGMERFMELAEKSEFKYIAENFIDLRTNESVFDPYYIIEANGHTIAFIGICTPETFTKSTPEYFQDEDGNYIYSFCQGDEFYSAVQNAVDSAEEEGADIIIGLAHLGVGEALSPYASTDVIANVEGLDAVIDGHSHTVIPEEIYKDKNGDDVIVTSTGTKFANIGKMTITPDGEISTELVSEYDPETAPETEKAAYDRTAEFVDGIRSQYNDMLDEVIGTSEITLTVNDPAKVDPIYGTYRLIRRGETNLGDFCADAYRAVMDTDIAFVNGGGIRSDIEAGDVTYGEIIDVHPYGNMMCSAEVTGQQILNALEMGASELPYESGGFLQVSGMSYKIDTSIPSSVVTDEYGNFVSVDGDYRVYDVMIGDEPLDTEGTYTLASHNYMLKNGGDGFTMFEDAEILKDEIYVDSEVLIKYITENLNGVIGEEYSNVYGSGRIQIDKTPVFSDVGDDHWAKDYIESLAETGIVNGTGDGEFSPSLPVTRAMFVTFLYRTAGSPDAESFGFTDLEQDAYYEDAVAWASSNDIVNGVSDTEFAPDDDITREQAAVMLCRYAQYREYDTSSDFSISSYDDADEVSDYALDAVEWSVENEIITGRSDTELDPQDTVTRAETAAMLLRLCSVIL